MKAPRKIYTWTSILLFVCCSLIFLSCEKEELGEAMENWKTLFMLQPPSAYTRLHIRDIGVKIACQVSGPRQKHE